MSAGTTGLPRRRGGLGSIAQLACAATLGLAAPAFAAVPQDPWSSIERECAVRTWAHDPQAALDELLAALSADAPWGRRAAAYEALWRTARIGGLADEPEATLLALERALAADLEAPNPRTLDRLLELAAVWPRALEVPSATLAAAAEQAHPSWRLAAVHALERACGEGGASSELGALLLALVDDEDPRVGLEARRTWVALPALHGLDAARGVPRDASFGGSTQGKGPGRGLSAEALERARAPADFLADESPLGLALEVRLHGNPDAARALGRLWDRVDLSGDRDVLLRAARAARARDLPLTDELLGRLADASLDPDRRLWVIQGLVAAGEPTELLERLSAEDAARLLGLLIGRSVVWDVDSMAQLIDPERSERELRLRALMTVASGPVDARQSTGADSPPAPGAAAAADLLQLGLADPDPAVVEVCFRALCAAPGVAERMEVLYAAWASRGPADRQRFLRYLPRELAPAPFRADLVRLAEDERRSPSVRAAALELLAGFRGDEELGARVDGWLADELARFAELHELAVGDGGSGSEADGAERRVSELRCTGLVRALHGLADERAVPRLETTLGAATLLDSEDLGKVVAALLGRTEAGRAVLESWLAGEGELRARIEAGLQLAPGGSRRAADVLVASYGQCERELKGRILEALGGLGDAGSFEFLERVARDVDQPWELRHQALAGMVERGRGAELGGVLREVFEGTANPELRRSVIAFFGALGGPAALEFLGRRLERIEALELGDDRDPAVERALSEREALLIALGRAALRAGELPDPLLRAWLRLPRAARDAELRARFVGRKLATTSFRYGAELGLAELVAATGGARAALAGSDGWWTFDARFLAALGDRLEVGGDVEAARGVWRAALVGLEGEGDAPDRPALELRLRRRLMRAAEASERWDELATLAELVLRDYRMLRTPSHAFVGELGEYQPERGRDPERRLASTVHQARARAALARGEPGEARAQAALAAESVGFSRTAEEAQARLERDLDAAR